MNINNVVMAGRLTKDPDLRYTPSGAAVVRFTIAVNRSFTNANGDRETDFINCQAWRKTAETIANHFKKGDEIGVTGRVQTGSYDGQDGKRVYTTDIVADSFSFGQKAGGRQGSGQGAANHETPNFGPRDNDPHAQPGYTRVNQDPFSSGSGPIEVSDDDLPF